MRRALLVDGRNLYDPSELQALGFEAYSIGRPTPAHHTPASNGAVAVAS
jgi:hypothetical protein